MYPNKRKMLDMTDEEGDVDMMDNSEDEYYNSIQWPSLFSDLTVRNFEDNQSNSHSSNSNIGGNNRRPAQFQQRQNVSTTGSKPPQTSFPDFNFYQQNVGGALEPASSFNFTGLFNLEQQDYSFDSFDFQSQSTSSSSIMTPSNTSSPPTYGAEKTFASNNFYYQPPSSSEVGIKTDSEANYFNIPGFGSPVTTFIKQEPEVSGPSFLNYQSSSKLTSSSTKVKTPRSSRATSSSLSSSNVTPDIVIDEQPPIEVRTRTPNENRSFFVGLTVGKKYYTSNVKYELKVELLYSDDFSVVANQKILGGTKTQQIMENGKVRFDNLCLSEASTKHEEREFCLEFIFVSEDGKEIRSGMSSFTAIDLIPVEGVRTKGFYAYSHKKVLTRRQKIDLRAISPTYGNVAGGEEMHVVGAPFIKGPSLKVVFRTEHGHIIDIKYAEGKLERFSDSVLFFKVPPYPNSQAILLSNGVSKRTNNTPTFIDPSGSNNSNDMLTLTAYVSVTNDSRHFSNQLKFTYYFKT